MRTEWTKPPQFCREAGGKDSFWSREKILSTQGAGVSKSNDLAIAKYIAGREKDLAYNRVLAKHGMTTQHLLGDRLTATPLSDARRQLAERRINADFQALKP